MNKTLMFAMLILTGMAGTSSLAVADEVLSPKDTAAALNQLAERAVDGQKGFKEAAENAASMELKSRFTLKSAERAKFAQELTSKIKDLGQNADLTGSVEASAHRAWIDAKTAVSPKSQDDKAVLGAVKTGEAEALDEYKDALNKNLPTDIRALVEKQLKEIQESYDWAAKKLEEKKAA